MVQLRAWHLDCSDTRLQGLKMDRGGAGFFKLGCDNPLRHGGDTVQGSSEIISCMQEGCIMNESENAACVGTPALALPPASGKNDFCVLCSSDCGIAFPEAFVGNGGIASLLSLGFFSALLCECVLLASPSLCSSFLCFSPAGLVCCHVLLLGCVLNYKSSGTEGLIKLCDAIC